MITDKQEIIKTDDNTPEVHIIVKEVDSKENEPIPASDVIYSSTVDRFRFFIVK